MARSSGGIPYEHPLGHRGFWHSLPFAALLAGVVCSIAFPRARPGFARSRAWLYLFLATASHGLLDMLTNGGLGVALWSPFENERHFFALRPIEASPLSVRTFLSQPGLAILAGELLWVWLPCALLGAALLAGKRWRARAGAALLALRLLAACGAPERGACNPQPGPGALGSICGFDHPEDLLVVAEAGLVLASGLRAGAGLWALAIGDLELADPRPWRIWPAAPPAAGRAPPAGDPGCTAPPDLERFAAHGLGGAGGVVAAVGHGGREAIELFALSGAGREATLEWRGCIPVPDGVLANDVALAPDGDVLATSFVPRRAGLAQRYELLRAALGFDSGEVIAWRAERGWRPVPGSRGAGPNGLLLSPDGAWLFVAENGRRRVVRMPRAGASPDRPAAAADVRFHVDNLGWASPGRILAVVHTGGMRAVLQSCLMDWALWEVDPRTLAAGELLRHDGSVLCGATSAVQIGERILIGTMSEDRIGVWRPARAVRSAREGGP